MPKVSILAVYEDAGYKSIRFTIDGKPYRATPKKDSDKARMDEMEQLLKTCQKFSISPFTTPLKNNDKLTPIGWHDKEGNKGLKNFVDVELQVKGAPKKDQEGEQFDLFKQAVAKNLIELC